MHRMASLLPIISDVCSSRTFLAGVLKDSERAWRDSETTTAVTPFMTQRRANACASDGRRAAMMISECAWWSILGGGTTTRRLGVDPKPANRGAVLQALEAAEIGLLKLLQRSSDCSAKREWRVTRLPARLAWLAEPPFLVFDFRSHDMRWRLAQDDCDLLSAFLELLGEVFINPVEGSLPHSTAPDLPHIIDVRSPKHVRHEPKDLALVPRCDGCANRLATQSPWYTVCQPHLVQFPVSQLTTTCSHA